ncbi:MAG: iron ABC transporter permease [archaeon]|nr:iron ABC transporter permease [archaeon]
MNSDEFLRTYAGVVRRKKLFILGMVALIVLLVFFSLTIGSRPLGFFECYQLVIDRLNGVVPDTLDGIRRQQIVCDLRMTKALAAVFCGATLAVCGAALQSSLKNPLADPYTTGISSGASLGVAIVVVLGITALSSFGENLQMIIAAFVFSLIPATIMITVSKLSNVTPTAMILTGVAVMYAFEATTTFLKVIATPDKLSQIFNWNLGNLGAVGWDNMPFLLVAALFSVVFMCSQWKALNVLSMDEDGCRSVGVDSKKLRVRLLAVVSICTAMTVCFTGTIGFVGLVAPHVARIFVGSDNKYLLPASAVMGGLFLLAADCVARSVLSAELPVGVVTSIVGGSLFVVLLIRQKRSEWAM